MRSAGVWCQPAGVVKDLLPAWGQFVPISGAPPAAQSSTCLGLVPSFPLEPWALCVTGSRGWEQPGIQQLWDVGEKGIYS